MIIIIYIERGMDFSDKLKISSKPEEQLVHLVQIIFTKRGTTLLYVSTLSHLSIPGIYAELTKKEREAPCPKFIYDVFFTYDHNSLHVQRGLCMQGWPWSFCRAHCTLSSNCNTEFLSNIWGICKSGPFKIPSTCIVLPSPLFGTGNTLSTKFRLSSFNMNWWQI